MKDTPSSTSLNRSEMQEPNPRGEAPIRQGAQIPDLPDFFIAQIRGVQTPGVGVGSTGLPPGDSRSPWGSQNGLSGDGLALPPVSSLTEELREQLRSYLPVLIFQASSEDADPAFKQFVRQARGELG